MPLVEFLACTSLAAAAAALRALNTCVGEDGGLQCCAVDNDRWGVGDVVNGRLILGVVACSLTALGTYLITSKATTAEKVPGKQFKAVEKLEEQLENVKGVNVEVLSKPE